MSNLYNSKRNIGDNNNISNQSSCENDHNDKFNIIKFIEFYKNINISDKFDKTKDKFRKSNDNFSKIKIESNIIDDNIFNRNNNKFCLKNCKFGEDNDDFSFSNGTNGYLNKDKNNVSSNEFIENKDNFHKDDDKLSKHDDKENNSDKTNDKTKFNPWLHKPTPEEKEVLDDCSKKVLTTFLPLSLAAGGVTYYGVRKDFLKTNPRFGSIPKILLSIGLVYFGVTLTTLPGCLDKLKRLDNSPLGDYYKSKSDISEQEKLKLDD